MHFSKYDVTEYRYSKEMTGPSEQCLFLVSMPDLSKLCHVFLSFQNCSDEGELRIKQLKTCRELLLLYSDVIASPVLGSYGGINMIMAIIFFKRGSIQAYAQRHSLQLGSPKRVLPNALQTCLFYSITARLAPNWNRVGQYLIAGKDFLSDAGKLIAVVLELNVNETHLCVSVKANTVRLPPTLLEDFGVPPLVMKRFLSSKEAVLHTTVPNNWCYILPSMKRGQIISISRKIPEECPFSSYSELQNHWTSVYGYHLPPLNDDEVVYCSVYFKLIGEKLFTYPLSCIRIQPVQVFPRVDLQGVLGVFMSDLKSLLKNICSVPVQMTNKPFYHTTTLNRPISQVSGALPANLTTDSTSRLVLTQFPSGCAPGMVPVSQLAASQQPLTQPGRLTNISQTATTTDLGNFQTQNRSLESSHCHHTYKRNFPLSHTSRPPFPSSSCLSSVHPLPTQTQPIPQVPKLVSIFKNKSISRHVNVTKILAEKQQKRADAQTQQMSGASVKRPHPFSSLFPSSHTTLVTLTPSCSHPPPHRVTLSFSKNRKREHGVSVPAPQEAVSRTQPLTMPEVHSNRGREVFESQPKRTKVTIQEAEVVKYAKNNQLAKINVATLQAWLRGHGVTVRSKDKKEELVSKVMQCLHEP
ncbi:uncharacterized protein C18orf63 isoform X1 [Pygocentrus nattereri]|uniref:uncharacterized protein C18orf63 isoform X1 n=2 Tax=Pygocentrus nattereri TaxID=42514 RepID=UPI000814AE53|nr:uncharacterized protein C18orf63 isoform X1 [Pygocentrus nattereri]